MLSGFFLSEFVTCRHSEAGELISEAQGVGFSRGWGVSPMELQLPHVCDGVDWVLFNASPDILTQIKHCGVLQPARTLRDSGIASIVLMDAQIDHTTGLLMLREHAYPLKLFCTAPVKEDLSTGNPLFKVLEHYCSIDWNEIHVDADALTIDGASDVQFKALPLRLAGHAAC